MSKRALAHIEKIEWIKPIEGADNIELIGVLGWQCIARKGEFNVGDLCLYIEIDSKVPEREEFEFLRNKDFKVKTMKLGKFKNEYGQPVISQGLALPINQFEELKDKTENNIFEDVTELMNITYSNSYDIERKKEFESNEKFKSMMNRKRNIFSKPWIQKMMKYKWFREIMFFIFGRKKDKLFKFPDWISKTDEERIENLPQYLKDTETIWNVTEKIDGTSATFAIEKKRFGKHDFIVCSRNLRQHTSNQPDWWGGNVYWEIAKKFNIENVLLKLIDDFNRDWTESTLLKSVDKIVLQGEIIGPKIQKNPYHLKENDFYAFNLIFYSGNIRFKATTEQILNSLSKYSIKTVPIKENYTFPTNITIQEFKQFADGTSELAHVNREGLVYRDSTNPWKSFKNVSNKYLLKHE